MRPVVCHYPAPYRKRRQILILNGYIDDSGSEPSSPVFMLAGYVLPADAWAEFSDRWSSALLHGKSIPYLHMKDLGKDTRNGVFEGWIIEEREEKLLRLAEVVKSLNPLGIAAHCKWSDFQYFKDNSERKSYLDNPYKALFHEIIQIMYLTCIRYNNPNCVDFVFDEHGSIGEEAASWYSDMQRAYPVNALPFFGSTPIFRDDKRVLPLQAADMFAWFYRRRLLKPVVRPAFIKMEKDISANFTVGSEIGIAGFEAAAKVFAKVDAIRKRKAEADE